MTSSGFIFNNNNAHISNGYSGNPPRIYAKSVRTQFPIYNLGVQQNADIGLNLTVGCNATVGKNLAANSLTIEENADIGCNLNVGKKTTTADLYVTANADVTCNLNVGKKITTQDICVLGTLETEDLIVNNKATIADLCATTAIVEENLTVCGQVITDFINAKTDDILVTADNISFSDIVNVGTQLHVTNTAVIGQTLDVPLIRLSEIQGLTFGAPIHLNAPTGITGNTVMNGNLRLFGTNDGTGNTLSSYVAHFNGNQQGIVVRLTPGGVNGSNNFIAFYDASGMRGRIEGATEVDIIQDPEYIFDSLVFIADIALSVASIVILIANPFTLNVAIVEALQLALLIIQFSTWETFTLLNTGIAFKTEAGDYAEYMRRANPLEKIYAGDVVAVLGDGTITKNIEHPLCRHVMVVSTRPCVCGAMPTKKDQHLFNMVAFMGQVPVKVVGHVRKGDLLVPSGRNDGKALAVSPDDIPKSQLKHVIGVAWSSTPDEFRGQMFYVNTAVGLAPNHLTSVINNQEKRIQRLEKELNGIHEILQRSTLNQSDVRLNRERNILENEMMRSQVGRRRAQITTANNDINVTSLGDNTRPVFTSRQRRRREQVQGVQLEMLNNKDSVMPSTNAYLKQKIETMMSKRHENMTEESAELDINLLRKEIETLHAHILPDLKSAMLAQGVQFKTLPEEVKAQLTKTTFVEKVFEEVVKQRATKLDKVVDTKTTAKTVSEEPKSK